MLIPRNYNGWSSKRTRFSFASLYFVVLNLQSFACKWVSDLLCEGCVVWRSISRDYWGNKLHDRINQFSKQGPCVTDRKENITHHRMRPRVRQRRKDGPCDGTAVYLLLSLPLRKEGRYSERTQMKCLFPALYALSLWENRWCLSSSPISLQTASK